MKFILAFLLTLCFCTATASRAGNVDIGVNVNIGVPSPEIVIDTAPEFLLIPELGLHISIGNPYNLFYLNGFYFYFSNNHWYRSRNYRGPWGHIDRRDLPHRLTKHEYRKMLEWRDRDYREYRNDHKHRQDRYYRPDDRNDRHERRKEWKNEHGEGHGHKQK